MATYQTIAALSQYHYEEKRSDFIAFIAPVTNREAALAHLGTLKLKYPDARHHCWAYLIGNPQQPKTAAFNDDGEPAGTAGKPILHVLTQRGAGDCCAIVVRYFGGIKLGAGGLVRAYGQAVSKALDDAQWVDVVPMQRIVVTAQYEDETHIRHFLALYHGSLIDQGYSDKVTLTLELPSDSIAPFSHDITQKTAGRAQSKKI